jgi:glycosyltransferase involved in cell wall biosynthesis
MTSKWPEVAITEGFSVVMPFHNEMATLRPALERLLKADLPVRLQVVLVDDGSTDGSVESVEDLLSDERLTMIQNSRRSGKGNAVRTGLAAADGYLVGILDADLEYDPADFSKLVASVSEGDATVAYGNRPLGRHSTYSFWYMVGGRLTSLWASILFNRWVADIHTCLKVAPLELWRSFDLRCDGFDLDSEVTARFLKAGHRIYEVPISYHARSRTEGKKLRWTDGVKSLWVLTRIRFGRR